MALKHWTGGSEEPRILTGFKDIHTGKIEEVMLIKNQADLEKFKTVYGINEEITKEY